MSKRLTGCIGALAFAALAVLLANAQPTQPAAAATGQAYYGSFKLIDTSEAVMHVFGQSDIEQRVFELSDGRVLFFNPYEEPYNQGHDTRIIVQLLTLRPTTGSQLIQIAKFPLLAPFEDPAGKTENTYPVAALISDRKLLIGWASYNTQTDLVTMQSITYDLVNGAQSTLPSFVAGPCNGGFDHNLVVVPFIAGIKDRGALIAPLVHDKVQFNLYYYDLAANSWSAVDISPSIAGDFIAWQYTSYWPQLQIGNKLLFVHQGLYEFDADTQALQKLWQTTRHDFFFSLNQLGCTGVVPSDLQMQQINNQLVWIGPFAYTASPSTDESSCAYLYDRSTSKLYYQKLKAKALPFREVIDGYRFLQAVKAGETAMSILNDPTIVGQGEYGGGYGIVPLTDGTALVTGFQIYDFPWDFGLLNIRSFSWLEDVTGSIPGNPQTTYGYDFGGSTSRVGPFYLTLNKTGQVLIWNRRWWLLYTPASASTPDQLAAKQSLEGSSPLAGTNWRLVGATPEPNPISVSGTYISAPLPLPIATDKVLKSVDQFEANYDAPNGSTVGFMIGFLDASGSFLGDNPDKKDQYGSFYYVTPGQPTGLTSDWLKDAVSIKIRVDMNTSDIINKQPKVASVGLVYTLGDKSTGNKVTVTLTLITPFEGQTYDYATNQRVHVIVYDPSDLTHPLFNACYKITPGGANPFIQLPAKELTASQSYNVWVKGIHHLAVAKSFTSPSQSGSLEVTLSPAALIGDLINKASTSGNDSFNLLNAQDYAIFLQEYLKIGSDLLSDFNFSQKVDVSDYSFFYKNYGKIGAPYPLDGSDKNVCLPGTT